jgi:hypothetical protein
MIPLPREDATPPVTNTYFVELDIIIRCNFGTQS